MPDDTESGYTEIDVTTADGVATVTLDRPESLNAITPTMFAELNHAFDAIADDGAIRVVVLTGRGRAFSAGVDLKALGRRELVDGKVGDILDVPARRLTARLTTMRPIVIAKVNGYCFTGALEIAMACDLIVVADEAKLGDTHAKFGLRPTWGLSQRLPGLVGFARARELSYTARIFSGREAVQFGLAARSAPADQLDDAVAALIEEIRANSPNSFRAYKEMYRVAQERGLADGLQFEYGARYPFDDTDARVADFR